MQYNSTNTSYHQENLSKVYVEVYFVTMADYGVRAVDHLIHEVGGIIRYEVVCSKLQIFLV